MAGQLFTTTREGGPTATLELALMNSCPWCMAPIVLHSSWAQPALFRHGGFGETDRIERWACRCGLISWISHFSENPRKAPIS